MATTAAPRDSNGFALQFLYPRTQKPGIMTSAAIMVNLPCIVNKKVLYAPEGRLVLAKLMTGAL